jgi:hypothetical protein
MREDHDARHPAQWWRLFVVTFIVLVALVLAAVMMLP